MTSIDHKKEADKAFNNAQKNITKSKNKLMRMIFGDTYTENKLIDSVEYLNVTIRKYKLSKTFDKYIEALILKSEIEKETKDYLYTQTLLEIADHFSQKNHYNEEKILLYYNLALTHCFDNNIDRIYSIYEKIIHIYEKSGNNDEVIKLCEKIMDEYGHLLNERSTRGNNNKLCLLLLTRARE